MSVIRQALAILTLGLLCAYGLNLVTGGVNKPLVCDESLLKIPGQVCLETVRQEWLKKEAANIVWVDARKRSRFSALAVKGAVHLTDDPNEDWDTLLGEAGEQLVTADYVVVYCAKKGCGSSKEVAERIRRSELAPKVYFIYGGWQAITQSDLETMQPSAAPES